MGRKTYLSNEDIALFVFLVRYKIILASDAKLIYESEFYTVRKIKRLIEQGYIKRYNYYYLRLGKKGIELVESLGYVYTNNARHSDEIERIKAISEIALITVGTDIEFTASWELKKKDQYTAIPRKFIGEFIYDNKKTVAYHITKDKSNVYIKQVVNDIKRAVEYKHVMVFVDKFEVINKKNQYFKFGKRSTQIIKNTKKNRNILKYWVSIDDYEIMSKVYNNQEILLSNYNKADFMLNNKHYIILMPFLDMEKLHKLKHFKTNTNVDILTLKENTEKIYEILDNKINVILLDELIGGQIEKIIEGEE